MIKFIKGLVISTLFLLTLIFAQNNTISADNAYKYVGEIKTVCGKVESVFYSYRSNGKPTFLNIDKAYPNNEFMIVIWGNNRYKFKPTNVRLTCSVHY